MNRRRLTHRPYVSPSAARRTRANRIGAALFALLSLTCSPAFFFVGHARGDTFDALAIVCAAGAFAAFAAAHFALIVES